MNASHLRISCVGDSITRGNAVHEPDDGTHTPYKHESRMLNRGNYPLLLRSLLASALIYHCGHGGRTAVNGSDAFVRTPTYLAALVSAPHVVVLMLGTNDAKTRFWPRYRDKYEAALHRLAHDFLELPSRPGLVLMAPPPVVPAPASCKCFDERALAREVPPIVRRVAERAEEEIGAIGRASARSSGRRGACTPGHVTMLDLHGLWVRRFGCQMPSYQTRRLDSSRAPSPREPSCTQLYGSDGVHTSERGAEAIAQAVLEVLRTCETG